MAVHPIDSALATIADVASQASGARIMWVIGGLAVAALAAAWFAFRSLRLARLIEDTPTAKIRSAAQGYVELQGFGRQMDGPPITAPLSGLPCVWYRFRVEEQQTVYNRGHTEQRWVTVDKGESSDLFWLQDSTGRVVIDPEGAEITPKQKDVWYSRADQILTGQPAFIADYFAATGSGNRHRFTEERLGNRLPLYALGPLQSVSSHADTPTVEQEVIDLLREWKSDQVALKARFDLDHDGKIDEKEWMLARSQARREVLKSRQEEQAQAVEPVNIMRRVPSDGRPYLLSAYPSRSLASRYRRQSLFYGALFFIAGVIALWLFNVRFA